MSDALVATVASWSLDGAQDPSIHRTENDAGRQTAMPRADVVVLELHPDGPMAYRYSADGLFAGDTWHESRDAALTALAAEYGNALSDWRPVPEGYDPTEYALSLVYKS